MDLNVKHNTVKLLEKDTGESLQDQGQGKKFLDLNQNQKYGPLKKLKLDKLDLMKMKNVYSVKDPVKDENTHNGLAENICILYI